MHVGKLVHESVKDLPESAAQEVLDFTRFLAQREASKKDRDLLLAQQSALADWDNPDDDAWNDAPAV
jgi:nitrous oxide reductase accessory protein NosL